MTAVTFGLIFNNIHLMLHGGHIVSFHTIAGFEMFACILSVIVTIYLRIKNKNPSFSTHYNGAARLADRLRHIPRHGIRIFNCHL